MSERTLSRVGVVGLGTMGGAMAANLARTGFPLGAWNRTPGRSAELEALGVGIADTPRALAATSDIILVCVSDTPDVEAVLFGPDGIAEGAAPGTLVIDCSTIDPAGSRRFATRLEERGIAYVDAPVTGAARARGTRRSRSSWAAPPPTSSVPGPSSRRSAGRSRISVRSGPDRRQRPSTR
jgi:3-hydroxyisobutyrate dehydrogenase